MPLESESYECCYSRKGGNSQRKIDRHHHVGMVSTRPDARLLEQRDSHASGRRNEPRRRLDSSRRGPVGYKAERNKRHGTEGVQSERERDSRESTCSVLMVRLGAPG